MRSHPAAGARIVEPIRFFCSQNGIREIILYHHERFDGRGYPHGLRAAEIPIGARIIAVADSLSAMIQNRCYRQGFCFEAAAQEISKCQGSQFCPTVVAAFLRKKTPIKKLLVQATKDFDPLGQHGRISGLAG